LFNKKLLMVLSMTAISSTLLTGCFSNERDEVLIKANNEYTGGKYEEAKVDFEKAMRMKNFSEKEANYDKAYKDTLNKLWVQYYKDGDTQLEAKNFKSALDNYIKASSISDKDADLKETMKITQGLLEEQNRLDDYLKFVNPIISSSNELLRSFNKDVDATVAGTLSIEGFKNHVRAIIPKSNDIVAKIDDSFTAVDGDIATIHQNLLILIQYQHRTFAMALEGAPAKDLSERYIGVKQKQTELIQAIQKYANDKQIAYRPNLDGTVGTTNSETNAENTASNSSSSTETVPE